MFIISDGLTMQLTCSIKDERLGRPWAMVSDAKDPLKFATRHDAENFATAFVPHLTTYIRELKS